MIESQVSQPSGIPKLKEILTTLIQKNVVEPSEDNKEALELIDQLELFKRNRTTHKAI